MIIQETVLVQPTYQNISYYTKLGYEIIRVIKYNKLVIPRNKILVHVKDLPNGSAVKILCKCDECGKERLVRYKDYSDLCLHCAHSSNEFKIKRSGKNNPMFGKFRSNHHRFGKSGLIGNKNPMWNPNITNYERYLGKNRSNFPGYHTWLNKIHQEGKCKICECQENLQAHHLNNWADFKDQRTDPNNGVLLCKKHHNQFHKIYGKKYTTKEMFEDYKKSFLL